MVAVACFNGWETKHHSCAALCELWRLPLSLTGTATAEYERVRHQHNLSTHHREDRFGGRHMRSGHCDSAQTKWRPHAVDVCNFASDCLSVDIITNSAEYIPQYA
jgi:hypothetical protein